MLAARHWLKERHLVHVEGVSEMIVARRVGPRRDGVLAVASAAGLCNVLIVGHIAVRVGVRAGAAVAVATADAAEIVGIAGTEAEVTGEQKCRRESG